MVGLGEPEGDPLIPRDHRLEIAALLLLVPESVHHVDQRKVPHDRRFVLQVVVEAQTLVGEMLADDRHGQVGPVLATELLGKRVAQVAGRVGSAAHLGQQRLPLLSRSAPPVPVRAGVFAAVVEELRMFALERLDLRLDERIELAEFLAYVVRNRKVHADRSPGPILPDASPSNSRFRGSTRADDYRAVFRWLRIAGRCRGAGRPAGRPRRAMIRRRGVPTPSRAAAAG